MLDAEVLLARNEDRWNPDQPPATQRSNGRSRRRERRKLATVIVLLTAFLSAASGARAQAGTLSEDRQSKMGAAIATFMAASKVPGLSVAIVQDGEVAWSAGFGMADLENSVAATSQTVYRLGSISKPLTATAAMALWEQGKLKLDSPVQGYCPAFPQKQWPITTRQLLSHLGGIRYYKVPEYPYTESQSDPEVGNTRHFENGIEGGMRFFAGDPLVAQPGTHFSYSTQGYTLAACAMEGASAEKYADSVRQHVLVPAGMLQTRPDDRLAIVPLRTRFYSKDKSGALVNAEFLDASYKVAGGGWLSSAPDMARFAVALLSDRLVKRSTRDMMWTPQLPTDGLGRMAYGLGWQLGNTGGVKVVGHGGSQQGTSARMLIAPEARAAVVVLTNSDGVDAAGLATRLLSIVLGLPARERKDFAVDPKVYDSYVGAYRMMELSITILREGDRLIAQINNDKIPLLPDSVRDYVLGDSEIEITFVANGNGRATELIMH
ncbi:MAG TPA: serine hydrolase, partial [Bryobacteraceae bacterium]|nr:serine hydrolase [Bryobacteraceae bacterium]